MSPQDRVSFFWTDGTQEKMAKFIADGFDFWSANFTLQDAGALSLQNIKANGEKRFFKITKKNQVGSIFIIIEDLVNPPYVIDNLLPGISAVCCQKGFSGKEQTI